MTFRLREALEERGLGQSEAARLTGVSFATINRMCTNATRQVSLDVLDRIFERLELGPEDVFAFEPSKKRGR